MESSAYYANQKTEYKKKIEEFKAIKEKVSKLTGNVTPCEDAVKATQVYIDQIIILGEAMDKGAMKADIQGNLDKITQNIESIIEECDRLIKKYTDLYNEADANYKKALAAEAAARAAAQSGGNSKPSGNQAPSVPSSGRTFGDFFSNYRR